MKPYTVFLSFNSEDRNAVRTLAEYLLDRANLRPWLDEWDLIPGEDWVDGLHRGLAESATCAVCIGKSGQGPWQQQEVKNALITRINDQDFRLIPVLLPEAAEKPELPHFLPAKMWVDFRGRQLDDDDALWRLECGIRGVAPGRGRNGQSAPTPSAPTLPPGKARRLRQQLEGLQSQWNLLHEKLTRLEQQYRLENRPDEQFRLEYQIKELKVQKQDLDTEMEQIETQLHPTEASKTLSSQMTNSPPGRGQGWVSQEGQISPPGRGQGWVPREEQNSPPTPNPFGDRGRIHDPARFFDREDLLHQIFEELNKGVNISLVGESALGKSSVLSMVCLQGQTPHTVQQFQNLTGLQWIYFNMELVENEDEFYEALCDELDIEACRGYKLTRVLRQNRSVLCLDEVEKMAWQNFTFNVRSHLRGLADGPDSPLKLVVASRSPLSHLFPDSPQLDSPLAGICRQYDLLPFAPEIARQFLLHRLRDTGVAFSDAQINDLLSATGGHPARLQEQAAKLYDEMTCLSV